ncbi:short-chain collagen C4 isoform X2 [Lingula anatina]|uniref:Short-chain collagen C4 isoform X2 n=1 Tax=Lingula anatina TaxID=7574 RepID=A0A1S3IYE2_LINAN|nr:short-chain collagen C4 isoform X2 [Lingula anatina]|eukprot:XP_013403006.1 short-chain collagen C4 isoform X2 [Lingula anatina]
MTAVIATVRIGILLAALCCLTPSHVRGYVSEAGQEVLMKMVYDLQKDIIDDKKKLAHLDMVTQELQEENKMLKEKLKDFHKREEKPVEGLNKTLIRYRRQIQNSPGAGGATYVRWGRTVCPSGAEKVYNGVVGSSWYDHNGGGATYLCLPHDPQWGTVTEGYQSKSYMYGVEFEMYNNDPFLKTNVDRKITSLQDHTAVCAVCRIPTRTSQVMIPAKMDCPASWTKEYGGYLMSSHHTHKKSDFVCVDNAPEVNDGGVGNQNGGLWYNVEAACGSLPCPSYGDGKELTCVVCTK